MKKTWSTLRNVLNHNQCKSPLPDHFIYDNNKITNTKEIAQSQCHYTHYLDSQHDSLMFLDPVIPADIINFTSKITAKSSQGHDGISSKLIKESIHHIATPFTHIVNQSLSTGVVPINMKLAKVIPIFKSGDKHIFNNYRPISILPAFSKNLEKLLANKLFKLIEQHKLFYEHQYGFRSKRYIPLYIP